MNNSGGCELVGGKYVTKDMIDKILEALKDSPVELEYLRLLVEEKNRHIKEKMLLSVRLQGSLGSD